MNTFEKKLKIEQVADQYVKVCFLEKNFNIICYECGQSILLFSAVKSMSEAVESHV